MAIKFSKNITNITITGEITQLCPSNTLSKSYGSYQKFPFPFIKITTLIL